MVGGNFQTFLKFKSCIFKKFFTPPQGNGYWGWVPKAQLQLSIYKIFLFQICQIFFCLKAQGITQLLARKKLEKVAYFQSYSRMFWVLCSHIRATPVFFFILKNFKNTLILNETMYSWEKEEKSIQTKYSTATWGKKVKINVFQGKKKINVKLIYAYIQLCTPPGICTLYQKGICWDILPRCKYENWARIQSMAFLK